MRSSRNRIHPAVLLMAAALPAGCAPSATNTVALIQSGDGRACSTDEVKKRLQEELTWFLSYRKLKAEFRGESLENFGFVFDPIVSTSARPGDVDCAAAAYLSLDGERPLAPNQIQFEYSLANNLNRDDEFVLRGAFSEAKDTARILYEALGVLEDINPQASSDTLHPSPDPAPASDTEQTGSRDQIEVVPAEKMLNGREPSVGDVFSGLSMWGSSRIKRGWIPIAASEKSAVFQNGRRYIVAHAEPVDKQARSTTERSQTRVTGIALRLEARRGENTDGENCVRDGNGEIAQLAFVSDRKIRGVFLRHGKFEVEEWSYSGEPPCDYF